MKYYPSEWNAQQLAYFAGLLSARIAIGTLEIMAKDCRDQGGNGKLGFGSLIERLEPQISADQWNGILENCERLFS
jgi:hypothetical protein